MLLPGVAFKTTGERLGHGGGYYDRYLARLFDVKQKSKTVLIGLAFKEQIVNELPQDQNDISLDRVVSS